MTRLGKFVITKATNGQFHFWLQAANSESILSSETYTTKAAAHVGISSVRLNAPTDSQYERKSTTNNQFMFNLKGANGERIGTSETYKSISSREAGITSCKVNAPGATVEDRT